jgi:hypothetical protein
VRDRSLCADLRRDRREAAAHALEELCPDEFGGTEEVSVDPLVGLRGIEGNAQGTYDPFAPRE